jgi:DNA-binding MarR family transcriptional regulator
MYKGRAPAGYVSISAYAGGVRNPDLVKLPNTDLVAKVHSELAELLNVSAPSASTMVERLVERSVLVRKPDPADRRKVIVTVSPDMVAIAEQIEKEIFGAFVDLVNKVGPDVADDWCQVLDRITEVLDSDMQSSQT